jgi:hypothetical protein
MLEINTKHIQTVSSSTSYDIYADLDLRSCVGILPMCSLQLSLMVSVQISRHNFVECLIPGLDRRMHTIQYLDQWDQTDFLRHSTCIWNNK